MWSARVPFAVAAGLLLSSAVFLALFQFVSVPLNVGEPIKTTIIDFTKLRPDTPVENKRDRKVERPPPQLPPTRTTVLAGDPAGAAPVEIVRTKVDVGRIDRHTSPVGVDRDVIPVLRVAPDYPARAQTQGVEGWVQIQFAVTAAGTVRDPVVVAAAPRGVFEDAALKAIVRWRYNPRIDGGVAVERVGLQTVIRFELQK